MKHYGDVTKINGAEVEPVDIITFGAPCQDLSVAGKRMGLKHSAMGDEETTRSGLFYEAIRIIKEMREATNNEYPKYAIYENVPGAFSSNKGRDFHAVLEALCSVCDDTVSIPESYGTGRNANKLIWNKAGEIVGDNYSIAWRTLDAQYWGVPQRRKRIYLVADFTSGCAGEILFKPESLRRDLSQGNEAGQGAAADAVGSVDGSVGVFNESGIGYWMPGYGCLRAEGENRPSRPSHVIVGVECLNPWDCQSKRIYNPDGIYCTLPAMDCGGANNQAVIFSFDSLSSNSMKSSNPLSGCRAVEVAKCIDTTYPDPSKNQGGVAVVQECLGFDMYNQSSTGDKTRTLKTPVGGDDLPVIVLKERAGCEGGGKGALWSDKAFTLATNQDMSVCYPINDKATRHNGGGDTRKNDGAGNGLGIGKENDPSPTVTAADRHAVCFENHQHGGYREGCGTLRASGGDYGGGSENVVCYDARGNGDGETACYTMQRSDEYQACDVASTQSARQYKSATDLVVEKKRRYIIRRLTPTECARLQGFPDWWSSLAPYDPADAEFWEEVRKTHAEINGKKYRPVKDLKKWCGKLHTDSAEYRMWGNGIALPNAEYVLRGIAEQGVKTLGSLFDGSGGFPLAGILNGIEPVWASEIEPFCIAVTKYHFTTNIIP